MDRDYGLEYRNLYDNHWWWRARECAILDTLRRELSPSGQHGILDIGCGDGLFFDKLSAFGDVHGVEVNQQLVSPDNPHRDRIHVGPFDNSYQPGRQFSVILMLDVLEHLPDPAGSLRWARELLAPDGRLLITVPAFRSLWTSHDILNEHFTRYNRRSMLEVMRQAALSVERMKYFFYWTCPVKLLVRLKESLISTSASPPQVPSAFANRLCYSLCRLEQRVCRRFAPPFGSSLMAVAGK